MQTNSLRPNIQDLTFQVYSRRVHPELYFASAEHSFRFPDWLVEVALCETGHVITIEGHQLIACEVATSKDAPLPCSQRLCLHRIRGEKAFSFDLGNGHKYHFSTTLDQLQPEQFHQLHEELFTDSLKFPASHLFPTKNRLGPAPISYVRVDHASDHLSIGSGHSFPDHHAILITQSLLEW